MLEPINEKRAKVIESYKKVIGIEMVIIVCLGLIAIFAITFL